MAPALGEGFELTARFVSAETSPMLFRIWAQGTHAVGVGRTCETGDLACEDASAQDARALAALTPTPVSATALPERIDDDPLRDFAPAEEDGPWMLRFSLPADTTVQGAPDARCGDGIATQFVNPVGETVKVFWVDCATVARAQELSTDYWRMTDSAGLSLVYIAGYDGVTRLQESNGSRILRWWIQGSQYIQVEQSCADADEARCAERTAAYLHEITASMTGDVQPLTNWNKALWAVVVLVGVPIATYLVILIPRRVIARRRQREADPGTEPEATAAYVSVDRLIRRARTGRTVRRIIVVVLGTVASIAVAVLGLYSGQFAVQLLGLFVAPVFVFVAIGALVDLVWRPHRLVRPPRRRGRPSLQGLVGMLLRGLAALVAVSTLMLYLLAVLFMWFNGQQTAATFRAEIEQMLAQAEGAARVLPLALLWLQDLQRSGWIVALFFIMVAIPIFLAYLLDRLGRRLARRSLTDTLAHDDRPYFLYLRGFDEDRLRIDESLGRRGFLEVFSPFGRPRFEEVLAEQLSGWGPVIAISGTKRRIQDLGAAKMSFEGDEWRDEVERWVGGARAVVLSATPSEVRAGLEWEIAHLASRPDAPPVVLVISPWPRSTREARWRGFLTSAGRWPLFRQLIDRPVPSATTIVTHRPGRGWTAYGARRRWDWSYAAALLTAIGNGDLQRAGTGVDAPGAPASAEHEPEPA
ncbi:hypothetical protein MRBLWH7_002041 [Microbacterium sp. LWH7-1.2]|uniref:hypothetical protein n=1 Tax=Microbacterium sp. LWH7-1.2 TaxID=3135257 RepID=UPI0031394926